MTFADRALFTPSEAAVLTQLPLKAVNNAIDKDVVPAVTVATRNVGRRLNVGALLALALERQLADFFVLERRKQLFRALMARPHIKDLIGSVKVMLDAYKDGKIDRVFMVNAKFVNTMTQQPVVEQLLPVQPVDNADLQEHWDYIYEPDAKDILDGLLMRYVESQVHQGAVENVASEMAARMVAMKSASDNAGKLIGELQLVYNKARQAAITKELSEIVGGAAAV